MTEERAHGEWAQKERADEERGGAARPEREEVLEALRDIPVRPPGWRASAAEVTARGRRRHGRLRAARAGAGLLSMVAVVGLAAGLAVGGETGADVVPAAPSALSSAPPLPSAAAAPDAVPDATPAATPKAAPKATAAQAGTPKPTSPAVVGEPARDIGLEEGRHTVLITEADLDAAQLTFDVVQFLTGAEARAAWREKYPDDDYDSPPNDFLIVNSNLRLRTAPVADGVKVTLVHLASDGDADSGPGTWEELPEYLEKSGGEAVLRDGERHGSPYEITVSGGVVTRIDERYVP